MDKKSKERAIFDLIYSDRVLVSVTPTEEPDFKVKNADGDFGVEITEFYFSQSEARIKNISSYFNEILDEKKYRDKDDVTSLKVEEVTVIPSDNRRPSFKVNTIVRQQPTINEYVNKISELIENKNRRFKKYIVGLNHVNLIIFDREYRLIGVPKNIFHSLFFQPQLEKILINTDFREIFLITQLGDFGSFKRVYIPLKMLFLLAEMYMFDYIMIKEYPDAMIAYSERRSLLYAEYLRWRGAKNVYVRATLDGCEVAYGNSGVFMPKDNNVNIIDYSDFNLSRDFNLFAAQGASGIFDNAFLGLFEKYKRECFFSAELCFDVNKSS